VTLEPLNNAVPLLICAFSSSGQLTQDLTKYLACETAQTDRYRLLLPQSQSAFCQVIEKEGQQIDCLIFQSDPILPSLIEWLHEHAILLPTVILLSEGSNLPTSSLLSDPEKELVFVYHTAERRIPRHQMSQIAAWVDRAIAEFLHLSPSCRLPPQTDAPPDLTVDLSTQNFLLLQQRRLSEKLKERLGYMGVYYKRNPRSFLRNMAIDERQVLVEDLTEIYRGIILDYFADESKLNEKIDAFVDTAFLADVSVAQVVEIHMDLMGVFAKQLRLEGRSEEVLLDYRLTLIDTLAHLCEMYRRSIPKESPES
jgi:circadian clock protein KaiA